MNGLNVPGQTNKGLTQKDLSLTLKSLSLTQKPMKLIVSLPKNDPELSKVAFEAGADLVKVHINVEHRASKTCFGSLAEERKIFEKMLLEAKGEMGIVLGDHTEAADRDYDEAVKMGFSFVSLYGHHMPARILCDKKAAVMMAADYTYLPEEIKAFETIGADILEASIIHPEGYGQMLNAKDLLRYKILCESTSLPVVIPTQRKIKPYELKILNEIGVKAIMIGAIVMGSEKESIEKAVYNFKEAIAGL